MIPEVGRKPATRNKPGLNVELWVGKVLYCVHHFWFPNFVAEFMKVCLANHDAEHRNRHSQPEVGNEKILPNLKVWTPRRDVLAVRRRVGTRKYFQI
jgi:hypothetical protein